MFLSTLVERLLTWAQCTLQPLAQATCRRSRFGAAMKALLVLIAIAALGCAHGQSESQPLESYRVSQVAHLTEQASSERRRGLGVMSQIRQRATLRAEGPGLSCSQAPQVQGAGVAQGSEIKRPCREYSAAQISAMVDKPGTITELLSNVKVAMDRALLLQEEFYTPKTLERFFNATQVAIGRPMRNVGVTLTLRSIRVQVDPSVFPGMAVVLLHGLEKPSGHPSSGHLEIHLPRPGMSLGTVRKALGRETDTSLSSNYSDAPGMVPPPATKGNLKYRRPDNAANPGCVAGEDVLSFGVEWGTPGTDRHAFPDADMTRTFTLNERER
jgi:hypothetical protein